MPNECPPGLEALLLDAQSVRQLARSIARDAGDVDDLTQDACLIALRSPPPADGNLRAWFARVLQNLVRQGWRRERRREQREVDGTASAAPLAPSAADLVQRAATHRAVVDAVLGLDEPYRSVVLLRFFEDQSPRAIGARLGVPVATVHTRLARALARLRQTLQRASLDTGADAGAWRALAVPLAAVPTGVSAPLAATVITTLVMKTKTTLVAVALVLASAVAIYPLLTDGSDASAAPARSGAASPARAKAPAVPQAGDDAAGSARVVEQPEAAPGAGAVTDESADAPRLRGRVVDPGGRALSGLQVVLGNARGSPVETAAAVRTGADGAFELAAAGTGPRRVTVREPGWATVLYAAVGDGARPPFALVVAAPAVELAGRVLGPDGSAVAAARMRVVWPAELRTRLSDNSDAAATVDLRTSSAADGAFALTAAQVPGAELWTSADGLLPDRRPLPEHPDRALRIVLGAPAAVAGTVQGQVVDPLGRPRAQAFVLLGSAEARTDASGTFAIEDNGTGTALKAAAPGYCRADLPRPGDGFPPFVTLTLGPPPLWIRGRVVAADGAAVAGARVWAADATALTVAGRPLAAEGVAAGAMAVDDLIQKIRSGEIKDAEQAVRTTATMAWPWVRTGADGSFALGGLEQRSYTLRAMDDETLLMVDLAGVEAGAVDVTVHMPAAACLPRLAGRVVDHDGFPVGDVRVRVMCDAMQLHGSTMHATSTGVAVTEADGAFELRSVPKERVYLRLDGDGILPLEFGRHHDGGLLDSSQGDAEHVQVVVAARRHVQVELADAQAADSIAVIDGDGAPIVINVFQGRGRSEVDTLELVDGRSPVFVVPDTAATLVLRRGDQEVRRLPLHLVPGEVNRLSW